MAQAAVNRPGRGMEIHRLSHVVLRDHGCRSNMTLCGMTSPARLAVHAPAGQFRRMRSRRSVNKRENHRARGPEVCADALALRSRTTSRPRRSEKTMASSPMLRPKCQRTLRRRAGGPVRDAGAEPAPWGGWVHWHNSLPRNQARAIRHCRPGSRGRMGQPPTALAQAYIFHRREGRTLARCLPTL